MCSVLRAFQGVGVTPTPSTAPAGPSVPAGDPHEASCLPTVQSGCHCSSQKWPLPSAPVTIVLISLTPFSPP